MEDNSGPVSWQWQCGHVSAGTTGPLATGAHVVLISGALHWIITIITRGLQGYSIVTASWQHCYSLVTTCQCSGAVMQSVTPWPVTRSHLYIWTPDGGGGDWGRKKSQPPRNSGLEVASWIVLVRTFKMDFNTDREWWCDVMRCGVEAVENIFIGSINSKFCFHPKFSQVPLCSTHCFIFHGSTICVYKRLVNMVGKQELAIW